MGLFDFLKTSKISLDLFVSEKDFEENSSKQIEMVPKTIDQLRKVDVSNEKVLKLEYFFYTNTAAKAKSLAEQLEKLNYTASHKIAAGDKNLFVVTGWTTQMKMTNEIVIHWSKKMCELGYECDCDFDGWGTTSDQ